MQDLDDTFNMDLSGLDEAGWYDEIAAQGDDKGFWYPMGPGHSAVYVEAGDRLIVTFESVENIREHHPKALPTGFEMAQRGGWSAMCVFGHSESWFRDNLVYGYFDQLIDDGFFDAFEEILFYGAGACGYAAAAYSVAAPGARVLCLQPQATLNPRLTEWDERFREMRRTSFTDRYGYAPDMLDAAQKAYIVYDQRVPLDAMHAALFTRPNVTKLRTPSYGTEIERVLREINRLHDLIEAAAEDELSYGNFARMMRARRDNAGYVLRLLAAVEKAGHIDLAERLCRHAAPRFAVPRFYRRLRQFARYREQLAQQADTDAQPDPGT